MRAQLAKAVQEDFSRYMQQEFPQFAPLEPTGVLRGGLLYRWQRTTDLNCYIYLQISAKEYQDWFTVELSCSKSEFPIHMSSFGPNDVREGCVRFLLPELYREEWRNSSRRIPCWWIGSPVIPQEVTTKAVERATVGKRPLIEEGIPIEQALPLVGLRVRDAIDRIKRFGIPFFKQFAQNSDI